MSVAVKCPTCGRAGKVPDTFAGQKVRCPGCSSQIAVAAPAAPSAGALVPVAPAQPVAVQVESLSVVCPFCAEEVRPEAKRCRHCGATLDPVLRAEEQAAERAARRRERSPAPSVNVNQSVSVHVDRPFGWHLVHLILTVLTCGLWAPVWLGHWLIWSMTR
jgi:hypothetical protein